MHGRIPNKLKRERKTKAWLTNIAEWTRLTIIEATRRAQNRKEWKKLLWSLRVHLRPPLAMDNDDDDDDDDEVCFFIKKS